MPVAADAKWAELVAIKMSPLRASDVDEWELMLRGEQRNLHYRALGLEFYREFPNDPRRWEWLLTTISVPFRPTYLKVPSAGGVVGGRPHRTEIDEPTVAEWELRLARDLKPAFLASPQVTSMQLTELRRQELMDLRNANDDRMQRGEKPDVEGFLHSYLVFAARPDAFEGSVTSLLSSLFSYMHASEVTLERELAIIGELRNSGNVQVQLLAAGREQIARLRGKPIALQFNTLNGERVDLAQLRGKVVLVDVWSLFCSTCIASMPKIKTVYDRYHPQGFEVVGLCLMQDEMKERSKVQAVLEKTGGTAWTNAYLSGQDGRHFAQQYGITGVPVTWLFDRNGLLVTSDISGAKLETQLRSLLGLSSLSTDTARGSEADAVEPPFAH